MSELKSLALPRQAESALVFGAAAAPAAARTALPDVATGLVDHSSVEIDGLKIFFREAGPKDAPAVLLLHGFPSSSHMFRNLIPALARRYRVIAPDYPGFGYSAFPPRETFGYSFEAFARIIERFTQAVGLARYALYIQDYGAPVGLRMALRRPERVTALIVQNGNAYEEGLSPGWTPIKAYWANPSAENRDALRAWLTLEGVRQQYVAGLPDALVPRVSPDTWTLDWALLSRPGNIELQLDLFGDYSSNVALYPRFHEYFRTRRPPTLIAWGRHDPFFTIEGAKAFQRDLPDAELHVLDAGHFALETHGPEIAGLMHRFLARHVG
jgi:pimeloyl-ACP methyl ester carboxylesterase